MSMNRVKQYLTGPPPAGPPESYSVIEVNDQYIPVRKGVGERVAVAMRRIWPPRWTTFRDIGGAEFTVRTKDIRAVSTSTPESRAKARAFYRARESERDEDTASW